MNDICLDIHVSARVQIEGRKEKNMCAAGLSQNGHQY